MTKKNGGNVPVCKDRRQQYVWIPCKQCYICKKRKAREWRMRLTEDIKENKGGKIVTLTFNTESLKKLSEKCKGAEGYELDNQICKLAVKLFRERWRKKYGRSPRHWLITELGHGETEHVHMHGIIWEDKRYKLKDTLLNEVEKIWNYGFVGKGKRDYKTGLLINYVDARTANYFTKYVNKIDEMHKEYKQIILTSAGIGKAYLNSTKAEDNRYQEEKTNQLYNLDNGGALPMPEYFRKKLYTDEQREKLTGYYLDKNIMYIEGKEIRMEIGDQKIYALIKVLREKNERLGYGDGKKNWAQKRFENIHRRKIHEKRFWEPEKKKEDSYWVKEHKAKWYVKTDDDFWNDLIQEAKDNEARESTRSYIRPNIKFDERKEEINYSKEWRLHIKTKPEKPIKNIYRFHTITTEGRIGTRYTYFAENLTDARIYAQKKLNNKETKYSRISTE